MWREWAVAFFLLVSSSHRMLLRMRHHRLIKTRASKSGTLVLPVGSRIRSIERNGDVWVDVPKEPTPLMNVSRFPFPAEV